MGSVRVLVVAAEAADAPTQDLCRHGYEARWVRTGAEALTAWPGADLVLLDLDLPDVDGLTVCRRIRAAGDVPIISVTSRPAELDRVLSLHAGSDDCLVKPYGLRELLARIDAVLRRMGPRPQAARPVAHGPLRVDPGLREVRVHDRLVDVTRKEFDLLYLLASHPQAVLPRKQIMNTVWQHDWVNSSRTLDMHVSSLRRKLGATTWIITVRGIGFRLGHG
jgi:DNA-binding response OmpR family regulator